MCTEVRCEHIIPKWEKPTFKAFIGVSQIVTVLLLGVNRTYFLGALISIPIWLNILMWDMTFMEGFTTAFMFQLSFYLILTGLLIYQARSQALPTLHSLLNQESSRGKFPVWAYLLLPIAAIGVELIGAIPNAILYYTRLLGR
ncbi:hypothetical protein GCM10028805_49330 [Spirosoma harenae]